MEIGIPMLDKRDDSASVSDGHLIVFGRKFLDSSTLRDRVVRGEKLATEDEDCETDIQSYCSQ